MKIFDILTNHKRDNDSVIWEVGWGCLLQKFNIREPLSLDGVN